MTFIEQAKESIQKAGFNDPDSDYNGIIGKSLIELLEVFEKQGHGLMSAEYVADLFCRLVNYNGFFTQRDLNDHIEKLTASHKL